MSGNQAGDSLLRLDELDVQSPPLAWRLHRGPGPGGGDGVH